MRRAIFLGMLTLAALILVTPAGAGSGAGASTGASAGAGGRITLHLDGKPVPTDVPPVLVANRTLVPLRAAGEALEADVFWDQAKGRVTLTSGDKTIELVPGQKTARVGGRQVALEAPAQIVDGRTLVPLRFVAEALGVEVHWDGATRRVRITDRRPGRDPHDPAALETFLVAGTALEGLGNYRAGLRLRAGTLDLSGTTGVVDENHLEVVGTMRLPGLAAVPLEIRIAAGQGYARVGDLPWTTAVPGLEATPLLASVAQWPQMVRSHPEGVRRATLQAEADGRRTVTLILSPSAARSLGDQAGRQLGHLTLTVRLDELGNVQEITERLRTFSAGAATETVVELTDLQPGRAGPVTAPDLR